MSLRNDMTVELRDHRHHESSKKTFDLDYNDNQGVDHKQKELSFKGLHDINWSV